MGDNVMRTAKNPLLTAPTVLGRVRECIRYLHYSIRTEKTYVFWIRKFLRFHEMRHPTCLGQAEVEAFLTWLADDQRVAAATHRQALAAILFLYSRVLAEMTGEHALLARLLYGTGMRLSEALQLRVKDLDFDHRSIVVRSGKGGKDR